MVSSINVLTDFLDDIVEFGSKVEHGEPSETLKKIYQILNFEKGHNKQLEANVVFEWLGATRLATFDNHTVENTLYKFMSLLHRCQRPRNFNFQRIYNEYTVTLAMPTATGFPFVYTLNIPTLVSFTGKVTVKTQEQAQQTDKVFVIPENYGIEAEVKVAYSSRTQSKITFITPFDHQHYIAGVDKNIQVLVPVKTRIELSIPNKRVKVELVALDENKQYNLVHYSKWPYVSRHNILEFKPIAEVSNTHRITVREPTKFSEKIGEQTGLNLLVQGLTEKRFFDLKTLYDLFQSHNIPSFLAYGTYGGTIEQNVVDIVFDPKISNSKSIVFTAAYIANYRGEGHEETGRVANLAKPTTNKVDSPERLKEFAKRVTSGIKEAESYVLDMGLEMQGGKPVQYVGTVAYASSPIDDQTRLLMYLRQMDNKNFEICLNGLTLMQYIPKEHGTKALEVDPKSGIRFDISLGEHCQETPQVEIVGKFKRTPERKQYLEHLPVYTQAKRAMEQGYMLEPAQLKIVEEAKILDNYRFQMKYQHVPEELKNMTYKVYSLLRQTLYYYVSEDPFGEKTPEGQAEMIVNFSPDLESFQSYIHTPVGRVVFKDVRVPKYFAKFITPRRFQETVKVVGNEVFEGKYKGRYK